LDTGYSLADECFQMWDGIRGSPKAIYYNSWKQKMSVLDKPRDYLSNNMWDANVVCKCLGKCPLGPFEDLGLLDVCRYGPEEEALMAYIYKEQQVVE